MVYVPSKKILQNKKGAKPLFCLDNFNRLSKACLPPLNGSGTKLTENN